MATKLERGAILKGLLYKTCFVEVAFSNYIKSKAVNKNGSSIIYKKKKKTRAGCCIRFLTKYVLKSVQFSRSVMSNSLQPHESQHARPPCPLPSPGVHSDSRPSSQ